MYSSSPAVGRLFNFAAECLLAFQHLFFPRRPTTLVVLLNATLLRTMAIC